MALNTVRIQSRLIGVRSHAKGARSLLRFAPIKRLQGIKNATGLAPQRRLIATEAIEREVTTACWLIWPSNSRNWRMAAQNDRRS
jgi:hypothetical protein